LGELCKYFDIVLENAHSALPDLEATIQVYDRLCSLDQTEKPTPRTLTYQEQRAKYMAIDYLTVNPEGDAYIHCKALKDPEAMRFILNELWRITQCQEVIS
jgi:DNA polymerase III epsilon subunit-like protein